MAPEPRTPAAKQLRSTEGMAVGEVFRHLSGLYFNGKLTYARAFASPPARVPGVHIITMTDGLMTPDMPLHLADLQRFAIVESGSEAGCQALARSARALAEQVGDGCDVIFLGSIGSGKYTDVLLPAFGPRLLFPRELVSRGQLGRGALLLQCVREEQELEYAPLVVLQPARASEASIRRSGGTIADRVPAPDGALENPPPATPRNRVASTAPSRR